MIGELLPSWVRAVESYGDVRDARLHPDEESAIARAVAARRREYATVRHCARSAMTQLGVAYRPLIPGERGAPRWPDAVVGSMTHCAGYRAAAVCRRSDAAGIGIDAEPDAPLPAGTLDAVALPEEREHIRRLGLGARGGVSWDRLLFSVKESLYKAWSPLASGPLGFGSASVVFDPEWRTFQARVRGAGPVVGGREVSVFEGRWAQGSGIVVTAVVVPCPG
ncbi:4'-phosphopantetheinyl transferase superfamily protein [Streptomyces sp. VRA16 Mangrove soil]|uniref:4'-phosphopantetheinyl transferase family protein n=1 Tax=Streptomyces sp. VRA16 Mangrove soil TaxID=2817434 RepID=UPI001A9F4670|nr:4'-phosphopantetheinyl transferase superfamily protein [Streptomyces sp. VRA16 Mangrove soil]MBO1332652.1 4'-phosphopantetheinyl transferase superfamily protein [Streptomyces sp. VRA16 Mangrove soil]